VTVPAHRDPRPFWDYLFWYTTIQCVAGVAAFTVFFAYNVVTARLGFPDPLNLENLVPPMSGRAVALGTLVTIVLAVIVMLRHRISDGEALVGYLLGNFICAVALLPLNFGTAAAGDKFGYPWNLLAIVAMILAYAFVLTVLIRSKRRHNLMRHRRATLVEPFT